MQLKREQRIEVRPTALCYHKSLTEICSHWNTLTPVVSRPSSRYKNKSQHGMKSETSSEEGEQRENTWKTQSNNQILVVPEQQPHVLCLVCPSRHRIQVALCHLCCRNEWEHIFSKVKHAWAQPPSPQVCKLPRGSGRHARSGTPSKLQGASKMAAGSYGGRCRIVRSVSNQRPKSSESSFTVCNS